MHIFANGTMNTIKKINFDPITRSYESGDIIVCQIQEKVRGGFIVTLPKSDIRNAFLPTCLKLEVGFTLEVFFVGQENDQLIFSITEDEFRKRIPKKTSFYTYENY